MDTDQQADIGKAMAAEPFDYATWKAAKDAGESTPGRTETNPGPGETKLVKADTKAAEPETKAAKGDTGGDDDDDSDHLPSTPSLPRSVRRELNKLRRENGELAGRLSMMQELQASGFTKTEAKAEIAKLEADAEPTREQFATDAEYTKAVAKWEVRQELAKEKQMSAAAAQEREFLDTVAAAQAKFEADVARFDDWAVVSEAMEDIELNTAEQATFIGLLAQSDQRAAVLYHLAKNPDEREKLFKLAPAAQIKAFHRLEGRVEGLYGKAETKTETKTETKPKPTAAELDAKKPKPTEAVAAKGGTAVESLPPMMLADGKTLNPAWKAARNAANGIRA
jgi:hypothetical protein